MSRSLSTDFINALQSSEVRPFYAAQLDLDAGPIRLWTGIGDTTIDGNTFTGAGSLLSFSGFEEVNDLSAKSISIGLSGLDETVLSLTLTTPIRNRKVRVYFGVIDASGTAHSVEIFTGRANRIPFEDDGETAIVTLEVDSKLVRLESASNWRYTHESHQARHTGDTFFSYVADLQDREIVWGRAEA